jgi:poly-gamma-glutamate synthesis protein (capsule biosynthesis protein)
LRIDDISPYDQDFNPDTYYFSIQLGFNCQNDVNQFLETDLPNWTNRDSNKFTSILLTGTTALTRAIGSKMELNGMEYPGEKIKDWFDAADISHISNEVSYYEGCPSADPYQTDLLFCGRPEYVELFSFLGVDVIELTGNHLTDKGVPPLTDMMALFDALGFSYYAAGVDAEAASQPLYLENNGNRIAFLGCNDAGPNFVFATEYRAGINQCDMERMAVQVQQAAKEGYLPIVTFQYWESYQFEPMPYQRRDFRTMIENGAVIVSGSQAHLPMTMEAYQQRFIHYGLGNLFFDQMDIPVVGTRREFLDRHIFYDGRYLGVDLLTAMLEDYSQPRPMTAEERQSLLSDAFVDFIHHP